MVYRRDIPRVTGATRMKVAIRARGKCQYYTGDLYRCDAELATPTQHNAYRFTLHAMVAHIYSPSYKGPRHMPAETAPDELNREWNLLLMCPEHHKEVDEAPEYYTPEVLLQWRDRMDPLDLHDRSK